MDKVILSYGDSLLYQSDVALLENSQWLNDQIIGFAFEYFETSEFDSKRFGFLHPSIVQLIKLSSCAEAKAILMSLNLATKQFIFIPLNDNDSLSPGGTHWSLVVCDVLKNTFHHFDSSNLDSIGFNQESAIDLCNKLHKVLDFEKCEIIPMRCPTQKNGHDCGVYVISTSKYLCEQFSKNVMLGSPDMNLVDTITSSYVKNERKKLKTLILNMATKS